MKRGLVLVFLVIVIFSGFVSALAERNACSYLSSEVKNKILELRVLNSTNQLQNPLQNIVLKEGEKVFVGDHLIVLGGGQGVLLKVISIYNASTGYMSDSVILKVIAPSDIEGNDYRASMTSEGVGIITIQGMGCNIEYFSQYNYSSYITINCPPYESLDTFACDFTCYTNWSCTSWSNCLNAHQSRTCTETNNCKSWALGQPKPPSEQDCFIPNCVEDWRCSLWNECSTENPNSFGTKNQHRSCKDSNLCGTTYNRPIMTKNCSDTCQGESCNLDQETCTHNWDCANLGNCENGIQRKTCIDRNLCNKTLSESISFTSCSEDNSNTSEISIPTNRWQGKIKDLEVTIERTNNGSILTAGENNVQSFLEIYSNADKVYVKTFDGDKELKITPQEALGKIKNLEKLDQLRIKDEKGRLIYSVVGKKLSRILFLFPLYTSVEYKIDAETGSVIEVRKPWWAFLASGV